MQFLVFAGSQCIFAELEERGLFRSYGFVEYFVEVFGGQVFDVAFVGGEVDGEGHEFDRADVGVREEDEFDHVVHAVRVGKRVADAGVGRQQVEDVEGGHAVGRILGQQVHEFGDEGGLFDCFAGVAVESQVVVDHEREVEEDVVVAGEEAFQFLYYANGQLHHQNSTIWSLYSAMSESFLKNPSVTMSRWKSLRSRQRVSICTSPAFLIFF